MALRIAFDLDGVFADMEGELSRHAEALFGQSATGNPSQVHASSRPSVPDEGSRAEPGDPETQRSDEPPLAKVRVTPRQQKRLWEHVEAIENFWETLSEIEPGSVARLAAIASERQWEVIFLTRRPASAGATAQVQSQRWLQAKGFALPSVFVVQESRGRIAASLGLHFVIDDTPENCIDVVVDSKAKAILVWRNEGQQPPATIARLGVGVAASVDECVSLLAQIGSADDTGVIARMKRLFGLQQRAAPDD